ncbi:MAG: OmpA family protein [Melioribacteraceae bacterium]|jgi:outer membrane protein OmpA-like peptidoglycan-associated protein|nr:OmpA family protein [Melioribacteraceae bacterium]
MKKVKLFLFYFIILTIFSTNLNAQLNEYAYKLGVQASYVSPDTYFDPDGLSFQVRPFMRFELGRYFDLGVGIGYGQLTMKDKSENEVKTTIIPADLRILFSPIVSNSWNPYLTAGIGGVYWDNVTKPIDPASNTPNASYTDILVPVGVGSEFALGESLILDLHATLNVSFTEHMTGYNPAGGADEFLANDSWWAFGLGIAYSSESCSKDSDNDGIGDCDERELGLDPNNKDTDSDGLEDGVEMTKYNTDPKNADSDGDKLKDGEEVITYNTNPLKQDSDEDRLDDFAEVITYKSDPLKSDTDGDKLADGEEVNKFKTDPTKSDTDNDKLNDYAELNTSMTDPLVADSDSDELKDGSEFNTYKTDPNNSDSDGDKLADGREVNELKTNPLAADTDGGGVGDFLEVQLNKNPLDPKDDVASLDLEISFGLNSAKLSKEAVAKLESVLPKAKGILAMSDARFEIQGHTDASGSAKANQKISSKRAKSVYDWFASKGIDETRMSYKGYGESQPKYSNKDRKGRAKNRRIELYLDNSK